MAPRGISVDQLSDTVRGLTEAVAEIDRDAPSDSLLKTIIKRGAFRPDEDEAIGYWFARFLTIRESLWSLIDDVIVALDKPTAAISDETDFRYFLVGYAAVCLLVRIDRLMLFRIADHSIIQRKLNEPFPEYRIERKQYTNIFGAFVDEANALRLLDAMKFARKNRRTILRLKADPAVGFIVERLDEYESSLDPSKRNFLKLAWAFVSHKWRRRGVVSAENTLAGIAEGVGRTASEFYDAKNKRVTDDVRQAMPEILAPGDVVITRHATALTNLFLPGFWPHAALYIGTPSQRQAAGVSIDSNKEQLHEDGICFLEAKKDGVRLRPIEDTLAVDFFVVLRPMLGADSIGTAIDRALQHEGKMYNFDFDFFNSDRMVCTEVVYRAYDGIEDVRFPLTDRAGRKTLSAEDLLDFALNANAFEPVAIFGFEGCEESVLQGDAVRDVLVASYRATA